MCLSADKREALSSAGLSVVAVLQVGRVRTPVHRALMVGRSWLLRDQILQRPEDLIFRSAAVEWLPIHEAVSEAPSHVPCCLLPDWPAALVGLSRHARMDGCWSDVMDGCWSVMDGCWFDVMVWLPLLLLLLSLDGLVPEQLLSTVLVYLYTGVPILPGTIHAVHQKQWRWPPCSHCLPCDKPHCPVAGGPTDR